MSVALAGNASTGASREAPLRVMIVDDSVVIRGLTSRWIGAEADMEVAASRRTGLDAVNQLERINPDVAVLDIEMPELDGISALPLLLAKKRNLIVIMASTLTPAPPRKSASRRCRSGHPTIFRSRKVPASPVRPRLFATTSCRKFAISVPRCGVRDRLCRRSRSRLRPVGFVTRRIAPRRLQQARRWSGAASV